MYSSTAHGLHRLKEYPSVSILSSTEPGPQLAGVDRARLQRRIEELAPRLLGDVDTPTVVAVMERLQDLLDELAELPARRAVALFASPSVSTAHRLEIEVRERTIVDDTFATRDLLDEARRVVPYVAVTVSERMMRVFEGVGRELRPDRPEPLHREPEEGEVLWERRCRAKLRELSAGDEPVVVFGAERRVADLLRSSDVEPAGVVSGNHDRTPWSQLATLARTPLSEWDGARNAGALHRLDRARSRRLLASGLDEVWSLAQESRVELLVVERNHAVPVRDDGGHLQLVAPDEAELPDVVDDAVDDLIEVVVLRGGQVVIVPDGALVDLERVAAVLRF